MQDKTKNIIITIGFFIILFVVFFANIIVPDKSISITERRKLAQAPEISILKLLNRDAIKKFDEYLLDQFVARDLLIKIKSFCSINILKQKDNNNMFEKENAIYKMEYPLNEKNIEKSADKINNIYNKYLQNMNVYYAIIPEKNYYLKDDDHLKIDYEKLKNIIANKLNRMEYIDIWSDLELEDYYKTDLHWRQENLDDVVYKIKTSMKLDNTTITDYTVNEIGDFYGSYYGQFGIKVPADKIYILTNNIIENCSTYNYETKKIGKIYEESNSSDKYDIYLSGNTPLISIENPTTNSKKELLIFRDSFGSSLAPLLIENYRKITLIDLRYISSELLNDYLEFKNQDVLFIYSSQVLNQGILK